MSHTIKSLGKIQRIDDDIWVGFKERCDCMEEMNESSSCGGTRLEGKLIGETEARWRRAE